MVLRPRFAAFRDRQRNQNADFALLLSSTEPRETGKES